MDGYEEAAFALRDVVLAEQRKPGGYDALATFLAFPRTSPLYKAAAGGGSPLLPICNKVKTRPHPQANPSPNPSPSPSPSPNPNPNPNP